MPLASEPFPTGEPRSATEVVARHAALQEGGARFLRALPGEIFFTAQGDRWSPAEHVRHLVKSMKPLVPALRLPRLLVLLRFGAARRASRAFEALRSDYRAALADGGTAGRFAPSPLPPPDDREAGRDEVVALWTASGAAFRSATARWSEASLDRCQLPHPLLGPLTVREMVYFTLYHEAHHLRLVAGRLPDAMREQALADGGAT